MTNPDGAERRRAPRARAQFPIRISDRGESREATVKDLSGNGLCCSYPEPVNEMTLVGIKLQLPDDERIHRLQGAVVRCDKRRGESPPCYEIAVYFTEIEPGTRIALQNYVSAQVAT